MSIYIALKPDRAETQKGSSVLTSITFLSSGWWTLREHCGVHYLQIAHTNATQSRVNRARTTLLVHPHTTCGHMQLYRRYRGKVQAARLLELQHFSWLRMSLWGWLHMAVGKKWPQWKVSFFCLSTLASVIVNTLAKGLIYYLYFQL